MNRNLDIVERTLRNLVEHTLSKVFPGNFLGLRIGSQLVDIIQTWFSGQTDYRPPTRVVFAIPANLYDQIPDRQVLVNFAQTVFLELEEATQVRSGQVPIILLRRVERNPKTIEMECFYETESINDTVSILSPIRPQTPPTAPGSLAYLIVGTDQFVSLETNMITIGRAPENQLVLDEPSVSRYHAQIRWSSGKHILFDLGSRLGTFVNGQKIQQHHLIPGDVIRISNIRLVFGLETPNELDKTKPKLNLGAES